MKESNMHARITISGYKFEFYKSRDVIGRLPVSCGVIGYEDCKK